MKTLRHLIICALLTQMQIASANDLVTASKGKAPGSEMKMKQSLVPQFDLIQKRVRNGKVELVRVKNIPRLNIGEEDQIKAGQIANVSLPPEKAFIEKPVKELKSPAEIFIDQYVMNKVLPTQSADIEKNKNITRPAFKEAPLFKEVTPPALAEPKPEQVQMEDMSPVKMKLLQAQIFFDIKKDYSMALALFAELLDEPAVQTEATYQLALTSLNLGLYSEYKFRMMQILNNPDPNWQKKAALSLAQNAAEGDKDLVSAVDPKLEAYKIELEKADQYEMNRSKYYLDKGDLTKSFAAVDQIEMESPLYTDALFLKSLILYKGGQIQEAIGLQQLVMKDVIEKRPDSEFRSVVALTLARLLFQAGQYKEAFDQYLKVDKKSSDWLQAMVEQAWTQIMSQDYEGAAGNMFSLHTDFFKKAFSPESYVARTVGYLNLCQFGDGAKVIYDFNKKYMPVMKQLTEYGKKMQNNVNYYDTMKTWVKNPDLKVVDGLPREFIYSLAKHPSFILEQKMINSIEDQVTNLNKININLLKTERKALAASNDARARLIDLKKKGDKEEMAKQEKRLMSFKIQHYIAKKARNSVKQLREDTFGRLEQEKAKYRDRAGLALKTRFMQMLTRLNESLDQSEVLKYELYSGAGEHLRYQMAGGEINEKERPELKVEQGKALNWDFKGEIWEDELGHYRSSLKNVCAPEDNNGENNEKH